MYSIKSMKLCPGNVVFAHPPYIAQKVLPKRCLLDVCLALEPIKNRIFCVEGLME
jgi:hypothetical protein